MYVYFNMPPFEHWDPREAIFAWINDKKRREHTNLLQKQTIKNRREFKGIFADVDSDDTDSETFEIDNTIAF